MFQFNYGRHCRTTTKSTPQRCAMDTGATHSIKSSKVYREAPRCRSLFSRRSILSANLAIFRGQGKHYWRIRFSSRYTADYCQVQRISCVTSSPALPYYGFVFVVPPRKMSCYPESAGSAGFQVGMIEGCRNKSFEGEAGCVVRANFGRSFFSIHSLYVCENDEQ
jgi:hypothetical protein